MNSSFLYHAWGVKGLKCTNVEYKSKTIILHVQSKSAQIVCPEFGCRKLVKNGHHVRRFIGLPIGGKKVILSMKVQRYKCKCEGCSHDRSEPIPFANTHTPVGLPDMLWIFFVVWRSRIRPSCLGWVGILSRKSIWATWRDIIPLPPVFERCRVYRYQWVCRKERACLQNHRCGFD